MLQHFLLLLLDKGNSVLTSPIVSLRQLCVPPHHTGLYVTLGQLVPRLWQCSTRERSRVLEKCTNQTVLSSLTLEREWGIC